MTTITSSEIQDFSQAGGASDEESLWSRIIRHIENSFARLWGYLNEDMGPVDDYNFTSGDCM